MPKNEKEHEPMNLVTMVNAMLTLDKLLTSSKVRQTHLKKQGRRDPETDSFIIQTQLLKDYVAERVAKFLHGHPAYYWFSRIKGVGDENIAKVVGLLDIHKAGPGKTQTTISSFWMYAGMATGEDGHAMKRVKGEKLRYNNTLRSMCWRLGSALKRAGLRQKCEACGNLFGSTEKDGTDRENCPKCGGKKFGIVATSKFGQAYLDVKAAYEARFDREGIKVLPTPPGNWGCINCGASFAKKTDIGECCADQHIERTLKEEPAGVIWKGHLENMAMRKVIKIFLGCLWLVWAEKVGVPVRPPYAVEKLGHSSTISPWDMVDRPEKVKKKKKEEEEEEEEETIEDNVFAHINAAELLPGNRMALTFDVDYLKSIGQWPIIMP